MTDFFDNPRERLAREEPGRRPFLRAAHVVLHAFSIMPATSQPSYLKGGLLMALRHGSARHTTDLDFSTPARYSEAADKALRQDFEAALATATEALQESMHCRIQRWVPRPPGGDKSYVALQISVGYAEAGSPAFRRLQNLNSPAVLGVDYSFFESVPASEALVHFGGGELRIYALTTLVAEKLRALLQQIVRNRTRRQDIYDLWYLLGRHPQLREAAVMQEVLATLHTKCEERDLTPSATALRSPELRERTRREYATLGAELPPGGLPGFDATYEEVAAWYAELPW